MSSRKRVIAAGAAAVMGIGGLTLANVPAASAASLNATDMATLRAAIDTANANGEADTIALTAGTYTLTSSTDEDANVDGDLDVLSDGGNALTIQGTGTDTILDGDDLDRLFDVQPGASLTLRDLRITDGTADAGGALGNSGGAVLNQGSLVVENVTFDANAAVRAGGAVEGAESSTTTTLTNVVATGNTTGATPGNGGALHITDTDASSVVAVNDGSFSDNTAALEGGALWNGNGSMTVTGATITGNVAQGAAADDGGGGIFNNGGSLTVSDSTVDDNDASGAAGSGGGIHSRGGSVDVTGGSIDGNTANRAGGGIEGAAGTTVTLDDVALDANDAGTAPGNGGALHLGDTASASVTGGAVTANTAQEGGGFWNNTGALSVADTSFRGNDAQGPWTTTDPKGGGAIFQQPDGTTTVTGATFDANTASGTAGSGGAILNTGGTVSVTGSTLQANRAERAGGGIEIDQLVGGTAVTSVTDSQLLQNSAGINGGAVHVTGAPDIDITGSTVRSNVAAREGGGLWNGSGTMTVTDTAVDGNTADGPEAHDGGGGIFNNRGTVTVDGGSISENDAAGAAGSGGGVLNLAGSFTATGTTIDGNSANRAGGGIEANADDGDADPDPVPTATVLAGVTLTGNDAGTAPGNGGGLHITGEGTVDVVRSTVDGNTAVEGGGLWNFGTATMTVVDTTVSNNTATGTDASDGGGGLFNNGGTLESRNVTLSGNTATGVAGGGAVKSNGGSVSLLHTTVTDNSTGLHASAGTLTIASSLVAGNAGDDCESAVSSDGGNVTGATCDIDGAGDTNDVSDPQLGDLADNGGPTRTHLPLDGSPAIDAATTTGGDCATDADQRDAARPFDGDGDGTAQCDAGSVEAGATPVDVITPADPARPGASPAATPMRSAPTFTG